MGVVLKCALSKGEDVPREKTDYTAEQAELNALIRRSGRGRRLTKAEENRQITLKAILASKAAPLPDPVK